MKVYLFLFSFIWYLLFRISYPQSNYNPHDVFDPSFDPGPGNSYRSGNGAPGPDYWQNRADYKISVKLNDKENSVSGNVAIEYTNNSPDNLDFVWLQLDQNRFKPDSKSSLISTPRSDTLNFHGGFNISEVNIQIGKKKIKSDYLISDTRMQIRLPKPLSGMGGKLKIFISYTFKIPPAGYGRSGFMETKSGTIYEIAQWYPRMAVYDDIKGWNNLPFLGGGEFYLDYGDFDCNITVPWYMILAASGELLNPSNVLTKYEIQKLKRAAESDSTIFIIDSTEVASPVIRPKNRGELTWHFAMKNTRDFSWAASKAFIWDAAKINLPDNKQSLAMSFYPVENNGRASWGRSTEFLKRSVEIYSRWFEYPYPAAVNVAGPVGGMEYPGIIFCSHRAKTGKILWMITTHEIGHIWFPMIVGSNERENAWMDEGFDTFINIYSADEFNNGEYAPKRDNEYAPKGGNPAEEIIPLMIDPKIPPIVSFADGIFNKDVHPLEYYKAALGLMMAREYLLGTDKFDYAFKEYINRWAFKHPSPKDFFRTMNDASGEDLNWFWKEWFYESWTLDQSVDSVKYIQGDSSKGTLITLMNNSKMVMPAVVKVVESNGNVSRLNFPVEAWEKSNEFTFKCNSTGRIDSVIVDPEKNFPDISRKNNYWYSGKK